MFWRNRTTREKEDRRFLQEISRLDDHMLDDIGYERPGKRQDHLHNIPLIRR